MRKLIIPFVALAAAALIFMACDDIPRSESEPEVIPPAKIVLSDGTFVSADDITDEQKSSAVAVIFDEEKKLGVGLRITNGKIWCSSRSKACNTTTYATSEDYGRENTNEIANMEDFNEDYEAFQYCISYSAPGYTSDWYLPAINELKKIYDNRKSLGYAFAILGRGFPTTDLFWSSTQSQDRADGALMIHMRDGDIRSGGKYSGAYNGVFPVRSFNNEK